MAPCNARSPRHRWAFLSTDGKGRKTHENYAIARQSHRSCEYGFKGCFTGSYLVTWSHKKERMAAALLPGIQAAVTKHQLEQPHRKTIFNYTQLEHQPPRPCVAENVERWNEMLESEGLNVGPKMETLKQKHEAQNWSKHAELGALATIRAFRLLNIPLILAAGSLLGWFRQCAIIDHTTDVDFYVPAEYMTEEYYRLMKVRRCLRAHH